MGVMGNNSSAWYVHLPSEYTPYEESPVKKNTAQQNRDKIEENYNKAMKG